MFVNEIAIERGIGRPPRLDLVNSEVTLAGVAALGWVVESLEPPSATKPGLPDIARQVMHVVPAIELRGGARVAEIAILITAQYIRAL